MLKSKYAKIESLDKQLTILDLIVDHNALSKKNVLFLDDNVGTGATMSEIKNALIQNGFNVKCGAVQYNWYNYYRVEIKEKNIERFNPCDIDYITQINYPGHKLLEHAIDIIKGVRDANSNILENAIVDKKYAGTNYLLYKERKNYASDGILKLQEKGIKYAQSSNFEICTSLVDTLHNNILTLDSIKLINRISDNIKQWFNTNIDEESFIS